LRHSLHDQVDREPQIVFALIPTVACVHGLLYGTNEGWRINLTRRYFLLLDQPTDCVDSGSSAVPVFICVSEQPDGFGDSGNPPICLSDFDDLHDLPVFLQEFQHFLQLTDLLMVELVAATQIVDLP
jgi:hypothetical protein